MFKRGGMKFEDYNYHNFNRYILIDPENPGAGETTSEASHEEGITERKSKMTVEMPTTQDQNQAAPITEAKLGESVRDEYLHSEFDIETLDEKEKMRQEKLKLERLEAAKKNEQRIREEEEMQK